MAYLTLFTFAPASIWLQIVLLIISIGIVLWGADRLTTGAAGIAQRLGMPQIVIGLTIVAAGTSMPEFFVSLLSAINGTPDLAVGNVVGSNIFNTLLIVGCTAMVAPIAILRITVRRDIPFAVLASVALTVMCMDSNISRIDAIILLLLFAGFMWMTLRGARSEGKDPAEASAEKPVGAVRAVLLIVIGLACLVAGSDIFVDNASAIAHSLNVSDAIIGLTIVAGGTSLPELATSVVSARKGDSGIAIGNVLGSNVFNILAILGFTGIIHPMSIQGITMVDLWMMILSMVLLWLFSFTKYRVQRWEGVFLAAVYVAYMCWLLANV